MPGEDLIPVPSYQTRVLGVLLACGHLADIRAMDADPDDLAQCRLFCHACYRTTLVTKDQAYHPVLRVYATEPSWRS